MSFDIAKYPTLALVDSTQELRLLPKESLPKLCDELRRYLLDSVSRSSGHFASGLGTVELTVALHYVYNTPFDQLIWDVGHQAYPHKILTGRRDKIGTIRQKGGLHPFPWRGESEYDVLSVGHSSTSISAGIGIAVAAEKEPRAGDDRRPPLQPPRSIATPVTLANAPHVEQPPGQQKSQRAHQERRQRVDRDADGEISRAPHQVHHQERRPHPSGHGRTESRARRCRKRCRTRSGFDGREARLL